MQKLLGLNLKKYRVIILIMITTCIWEKTLSQNNIPYQLHAKYWNYRTRLRNDFMVVGPDQGMSIPMQERGLYYYPYTNTQAPNYNFDSDPTSYGAMVKWGDAMSDLGYYLGVLATEYALLRQNNQSTDSTVKELYYALYALNRMDLNADRIFQACLVNGSSPPVEPATNQTGPSAFLNGFSIRDDVPGNFLTKYYDKLNYYGDGGYCSNVKVNDMYDEGSNEHLSTWYSTGINHDKGYNFISQDNWYNALLGLTLVRKLVINNNDLVQYMQGGVPSQFQDGETSIRYEAYLIARRTMDYFKENDFHLLYPDGTAVGVDVGGHAKAYSFGHYEIFCKMRDGNWSYYNPTVSTGNAAFYDACAYYDWTHVNTGHPVLDGITNGWRLTVGTGLRYGNYVGSSKALCSENNRDEWLWEFSVNSLSGTNDKAVMTANLMGSGANRYSFYGNATGLVLDDKVNSIGDQDYSRNIWHAQLLRAVNFGYEQCSQLEKNPFPSQPLLDGTYSMLQTAPCMGTYAYPQNPIPLGPTIDVEWHTTNRLDWPDRRHKDNVGGFPAEYNGIDYMLYHNLYFLTRKMVNDDVYNRVVDFSNRNVTLNYPLSSPNTSSGNPWGSNSNPATIGAFECIVASSTLNSNSNVAMIAGKQIDMKPGFTVVNGANYTATIDRLDCNSIFNQHNQYMYVNGRIQNTDDDDLIANMAMPTDYQPGEYIYNSFSGIPKQQFTLSNDIKSASTIVDKLQEPNIYPNPNSGKFKITTDSDLKILNVEIVNQFGQTIFKSEYNNLSFIELNIKDYADGLYFAKVKTEDNKIYFKKIIKQ